MYSLRQAADAADVDKMTVSRAIKSGKLSAKREGKNGAYQIDPSELHRVFPPKPKAISIETSQSGAKRQNATPGDTALLEKELEFKAQLLEKEQEERRRERQRFEDQISDLQTRLDQQHTEALRLTSLLTDQTKAAESDGKRGFWAWLSK